MKRLAITALKIAVSAALLWFLFHRIALAPVIADLKRVRPGPAALVLALGAAQIFLFTARWQRVARICHAPLRWRAHLRLIFIGLFFNQTLPSSMGGDAVRLWLSVRMGVPAGRAFTSLAVDRFVALIVLMGLSIATLPLFYRLVGDAALRHGLSILLAVGAAGFIFLLLGGSMLAARLHAWRVTAPLGARLMIVSLSLAIHLMSVAIILLIAAGLGIGFGPDAALVLVPPILLVSVVPIAIAGWGLREGAMVVALAQVHVAAPDALAISILYGLLQILTGLPGAVLWWRQHDKAAIGPVSTGLNPGQDPHGKGKSGLRVARPSPRR
jgi:uncharacterized membrane protein YbhN (UPF0104 family)